MMRSNRPESSLHPAETDHGAESFFRESLAKQPLFQRFSPGAVLQCWLDGLKRSDFVRSRSFAIALPVKICARHARAVMQLDIQPLFVRRKAKLLRDHQFRRMHFCPLIFVSGRDNPKLL